LVRRDLKKNDLDILATIRERQESLRDVYDSRVYYLKQCGRNANRSTLSPNTSISGKPVESTAVQSPATVA
jgi:hypothetical protein